MYSLSSVTVLKAFLCKVYRNDYLPFRTIIGTGNCPGSMMDLVEYRQMPVLTKSWAPPCKVKAIPPLNSNTYGIYSPPMTLTTLRYFKKIGVCIYLGLNFTNAVG